MTDETPTPETKKPRNTKADIVDAEIVEDTPVVDETPVVVEKAQVETVPMTDAEVSPTQPAERVVYVTTPAPPAKKGNRGIGSVIAIVSALVFTALLAVITAIVGVASGAPFGFGFLGQASFYIPVLFFVVGFVLLVLILNRAAWWGYIIGSILIAVFVYFGTIGLGLLGTGVISNTPAEASARFAAELRNPFIIVSALLAREVSLWTGAAIARRGRSVRTRNAEARAKFESELAEKKAEHANAGVSTAV
ncbi:MAG: hypothetical protein ABJB03_12830 [Rhodoglobus sp.]